VTLEWAAVADGRADLSAEIAAAYGPGGLGILTVSGIPELPALRRALLPLATEVADLGRRGAAPEDPESMWSFGWSCGRETLEGGEPDTNKGSYYANPALDRPTEDAALMAAYPSYCRPNLWPEEGLPELQGAFMGLGQLMLEVGSNLARHCDVHVARETGAPSTLEGTIRRSVCHKGRLLHYFPPPEGAELAANAQGKAQWCGWHNDHGSLTGLTSAMYQDASGAEVDNPDPDSGLFIKNRDGEVVQVGIPRGHLAFQIGESSQIMSGGVLRATPHCVTGASGPGTAGMCRNTFAVFMQPRWDADMSPARTGAESGDIGLWKDAGRWEPGVNFGEFTERTLSGYY